ncbi:MAG: 6-phosphogluconolactonase [Caldilineaceae bacterium]
MNATTLPNFHVFTSTQSLSAALGAYIVQQAATAVAQRGRFTVAFSGGSLPSLASAALTQAPLRDRVDWAAWQLFFADERCVPLTDAESNYRLVQAELLQKASIPPEQVYTIQPELDPAVAAQAYQAALAQSFQTQPPDRPHFDLILLGMGPDGHTASLFPHHPLLYETSAWVAPIFDSPKPPPERITLTLPVFNAARAVAFVITGASKAQALVQVFEPQTSWGETPAGLVRPTAGELVWFVDEAAAALVK